MAILGRWGSVWAGTGLCLQLAACGPPANKPPVPVPAPGGQGGPAPGAAGGGGSQGAPQTTDLALQIAPGQGFLSRASVYRVQAQWTIGPSTTLYNTVVLTFADKNGRALSSFSLQRFIPWNYTLGQGSNSGQIPLSPSLRNPALLTASNFLLQSRGQWVLQVTATANGASDIADVPFNVVN